MENKITLPRVDKEGVPYLSYSQYTKWLDKPRDYIRQYFFGEKEDNLLLKKYGDFGHKVGESFENNDFTGWGKKEADFLQSLPSYDEFETEVRVDMGSYYILGYVDSNTKPIDGYVEKLLDYKTGIVDKVKDKYKSEDYKQVDLYAMAFKQKYGKLPKKGYVVIVGRDGNAFAGEDLTLSLDSEIVERPLSLKRCKQVVDDFGEVGSEISEYYKVFNKLIQKDVTN